MRQPRVGQHLTDLDTAKLYLFMLQTLSRHDARQAHDGLVRECRERRTPQWAIGIAGEPKRIGWHPAKRDRPKCGARTRKGAPCKAPSVAGGKRCRIHGGASTGPRTAEGLKRSLAAANAGWQRWNAARQAAKAQSVSSLSEQRETQPE